MNTMQAQICFHAKVALAQNVNEINTRTELLLCFLVKGSIQSNYITSYECCGEFNLRYLKHYLFVQKVFVILHTFVY